MQKLKELIIEPNQPPCGNCDQRRCISAALLEAWKNRRPRDRR